MGELTNADVLRILELIDKSQFDYFQLTLGDLHLTVSKEGPPPGAATAPPAAAPASAPLPAVAAPPAAAPPPAPASAAPTAPAAAVAPAASGQAAAAGSYEAGLVPVVAPMVGTFYRAPSPDAPPFVEVGSRVEAETTVALVEAMKVFTSVLAGTAGTVAQILVENAQFVEYGQPLFLLRPAAPSAEA